jgi:hypothetical protein
MIHESEVAAWADPIFASSFRASSCIRLNFIPTFQGWILPFMKIYLMGIKNALVGRIPLFPKRGF